MTWICFFCLFGMGQRVKRGHLESLLQRWGWEWRVGSGGREKKGKIYRQPADFPGRSGLVIDKINTPIQTEYALTGPVLTMYPRVTSNLQQSSCLSLLLMDLRICSTTSGYSVFVNESFSFQTPKDKEVCYISSSQ